MLSPVRRSVRQQQITSKQARWKARAWSWAVVNASTSGAASESPLVEHPRHKQQGNDQETDCRSHWHPRFESLVDQTLSHAHRVPNPIIKSCEVTSILPSAPDRHLGARYVSAGGRGRGGVPVLPVICGWLVDSWLVGTGPSACSSLRPRSRPIQPAPYEYIRGCSRPLRRGSSHPR